MKTIGKVLQSIFAIAFLIGIGYLGYKFVEISIDNIDKVDSNIVVALIAGTITILGYFITRYLERKKQIEQEIRKQKLPIYEEFLDFIFKFMVGNRKNNISEQDLEQFMFNFNKKSIIWLSDESLKAYVNWRTALNRISGNEKNDKGTLTQLIEFEKLLLAFRKDIGHSNQNLNSGDILSVFINDIDKYIKR